MKKLLYISMLTLLAHMGMAQENQEQDKPKEHPNVGSPDQVDNLIKWDRQLAPFLEVKFFDPYFDFTDKLDEKLGLKFAVDYNALYQNASADLGAGEAGSGVFRFYGSWGLIGKKSGNLGRIIFKVEHRHAYTDVPPASLGLDMGYVGKTAVTFSDQQWRATNLYWRQHFGKGRFAVVLGFMDVTDFFDVHSMSSPWLYFSNSAFSAGAAAVAFPNDGYLGIAAGGWLFEHVYAIAGLADINGDPTDIFGGFETFFNENEYFKHVELGFSDSKEYMYHDNFHISFWQRDARTITNTPKGWGVILSASRRISQLFSPFARFAYAEDAGTTLSKSLSLGLGFHPLPGSHMMGLGFNWGEVNETTFGPGLDNQATIELFFRLHITKLITITPDFQYLINPALNPDESGIFLYGFRGRITL